MKPEEGTLFRVTILLLPSLIVSYFGHWGGFKRIVTLINEKFLKELRLGLNNLQAESKLLFPFSKFWRTDIPVMEWL